MNITIVTLTCTRCRQPFERPKRRHDPAALTFYCSRVCRRQWKESTCEACGKKFIVKGESRSGRWCSRTCTDIGRKQGKTQICPKCFRSFYVYPSQPKVYCSIQCYNTVKGIALRGRAKSAAHRAKQSAAMKGRPSPNKLPPIMMPCTQCRFDFEIPRRTARHYRERIRFCSTTCWYEYIRDHPENHPSYRGGYEPYYGPNWHEQARLARDRDGHTCQDCGKDQLRPRLDVHHIVPRRLFSGDWRAANILENLVTLCKSCHTLRELTLTESLRSV